MNPVNRRTFLKYLGYTAAVTVTPSVLAACGGGAAPSGGPAGGGAGAAAGGPKSLQFFHWRNEDVDAYEKVFANFKKETGIAVSQEIIQTNNYKQTLLARNAGKQFKDLVATHPNDSEYGALVRAGALTEITDKPYVKNFTDAGLGAMKHSDGKIYSILVSANILTVYYNKDLFAKAGAEIPTDWNGFIGACDKLKKAGITPISMGGKEFWVPALVWRQIFATKTVGKDPTVFEKLVKKQLKFAQVPGMEESLTMFFDLKRRGYFQQGDAGTSYDEATALFARGDAAMWVTGSWSIPPVQKANPKLSIGFFQLPGNTQPGEKAYGSYVPGLNCGVVSYSANKAEAEKFLEFLCQPQSAQILQDDTLQFFPIKGLTSQSPVMAELSKLLPTALDFGPYYNQLGAPMNDISTAIAAELGGSLNPKSVIAEGDKSLQQM